METIQSYNVKLDTELTIKYDMFFGQYGYIGLNAFESATLDFIVKCFKANMNNNFYALAESRLKEMYELVGIDPKNY